MKGKGRYTTANWHPPQGGSARPGGKHGSTQGQAKTLAEAARPKRRAKPCKP